MLYFPQGAAYLCTDKGVTLASKSLCEVDPKKPVLVAPLDGTPPFSVTFSSLECIALDGYIHAFLPPSPHARPKPRRILSSYREGANEFLVCEDGYTCLFATCYGEKHCFPLPHGLASVSMRYAHESGLFALTAMQAHAKYLFVARFLGSEASILIDTLCQGVEQKEGRTYVLVSASQCGTLGTVTVYDREFARIDCYAVKTGSFTVADCAMLAFEYALQEDASGLASVLTGELFASMSVSDLHSYFAEYERIYPMKNLGESVYALVRSDGRGELALFTKKEGRVDDVSEFSVPSEFLAHTVSL